MASVLHEYLARDHDRLDAHLRAALRDDGSIDEQHYAEFRRGLLRHIGIEQKILFLELKRRVGESELVRQLHRDHAALSALLVPPPTREGIETIRAILDAHNPLEEVPGGLYEIFEEATGEELDALMEKVRAYPEVPMAPYSDTPLLREATEKLLREAEEGRKKLRT
ncbi:MAG TPA: hemerythrin domain-containing protein [Thermoanaerobaculia bacterium]